MKRIKVLSLVGSTYPLDRLTKQVDEIGKNKKYDVFAQIGDSSYRPKKIKWAKFLAYKELQKKIMWADIVISHAGAGSIIDVLAAKKRLVLFPRLSKYGEAVDDHQVEICKKFNFRFGIIYITNLKKALPAISSTANIITSETPKLIKEINNIIK